MPREPPVTTATSPMIDMLGAARVTANRARATGAPLNARAPAAIAKYIKTRRMLVMIVIYPVASSS
jgi:hypothetical protein